MTRNINIILFSILLALMVSCSVQGILVSEDSGEDAVYVEFVDKPRKFEAKKEYRMRVIDFSDSYSEVSCRVNQGSIKKHLILDSPYEHFTLEPYKSGNLTIFFYRKEFDSEDKPKLSKIGTLEIEIE